MNETRTIVVAGVVLAALQNEMLNDEHQGDLAGFLVSSSRIPFLHLIMQFTPQIPARPYAEHCLINGIITDLGPDMHSHNIQTVITSFTPWFNTRPYHRDGTLRPELGADQGIIGIFHFRRNTDVEQVSLREAALYDSLVQLKRQQSALASNQQLSPPILGVFTANMQEAATINFDFAFYMRPSSDGQPAAVLIRDPSKEEEKSRFARVPVTISNVVESNTSGISFAPVLPTPTSYAPNAVVTSLNALSLNHVTEYQKFFESCLHGLQFDKELAKFPLAVEVEKRTKVPKTYIFGGAGAVAFILVFLNIWGNLLTNILGFVWPAYQSFKAIESSDKDDDRQWLTYWTVFGFLNLIEFFSDILLYWVPFYYTFKAILILYLILPQFKGATVIYNQVLRPYLIQQSNSIDGNINKLKAKAASAINQVESDIFNKSH
ncbi:ER membrane protein DP1/Yop1 [Chytridiales sp. JEL 0842]|nr:ER membrane protein DP1/Yop1 [Chytridiales sp. JEL 0842]